MAKVIGFVSTRFAGTDGVTLEASKWAEVLREAGHEHFWFAGELDRSPKRCFLVPEAHFKYERNRHIDELIFGRKTRPPEMTDMIHDIKTLLKRRLREFIKTFAIDILLVENALTIPMHIPLGVAITEVIAESGIPTIAHHHDFFWERTRFLVNAVGDYLRMAFPPNLHNIEHVVINSAAQEELALRTGISSLVIPNIIDFEHPPVPDPERGKIIRKAIGLAEDDIIILQPTRIVQRKGIEHAIELVKALKNPQYKLVISHEAGDEGFEYAEWLKEYAASQGVALIIVPLRFDDPWNPRDEPSTTGRRQFSLLDIYPHADFITYPSLYEGFGNAFLEAVYFHKPMLINRYAIFVRDIEPMGFDLVTMDGFLSTRTVRQVREILESPNRRAEMVAHNYAIARKHYSYDVLRKRLAYLFNLFFGSNG